MLLTITTTYEPATDLGYLLHKNPAHAQEFELPFGKAHVFFPEASAERCTAGLLLDIDPVALVRGRGGEGGMLQHYVNDRPYVASSFLSVALGQVFRTALGGRSKERPELAKTPIPLEATLHVLSCRGGEGFLRRLFEPLGYTVNAQGYPLDEQFEDWGQSSYFTVSLTMTCRLSDLLTHLYVLVPVLDDEKHYYVGEQEVEKLLRHGEGWLAAHPERDAITRRYLLHRRNLQRMALEQLLRDEQPDAEATEDARASEEAAVEQPMRLNDQRLAAVHEALKGSGAKRIIDLGCGEGNLLRVLLADRTFEKIVGVDVSYRSLEKARARLRLDRLPANQQDRIEPIHGSLTYRDRRLEGYDAAAVVEVIEHLDPPRLAAFERVVFEHARPGTVVVTTPNVENNVHWETLPAGKFRHKDHRFEWTRAEFQTWAEAVCTRFGYTVHFHPIGPEDPTLGAPTQMGVFTRG